MILAMVILLILGIILFICWLQTYKPAFYIFLFFSITSVFILSIILGMPRMVIFSKFNFHTNFIDVLMYSFFFTTIFNILILIVLAFLKDNKKMIFTFIYIVFTILNIFVSTLCSSKIFLEEDILFIIKESYGSYGGLFFNHLIEHWYFLVLGIIYIILFAIYLKTKNKYFLKIKKEIQ